jgi:GNAT superfamily N-acetyltransferase
MMIPHSTVTVRLFRQEDQDTVFRLYGEVFGEAALHRFEQRWHWQFLDTPAAKIVPMLSWVAEHEGAIVGFLGAFPTRIKVIDQEFVIYHDCDLIVAPHMRRQGVAKRLVQAYDESASPLLSCMGYAPVNGRIRQHLGYHPAHLIPQALRPLQITGIAQHLLANGRIPRVIRHPPMSWIISASAAGLGTAISLLNRILLPPRRLTVRVEPILFAGDEFDHLWETLRGQFPIVVVRDKAFVQWRFIDDPVFTNTVLVARKRDGTLKGYLAARTSQTGAMRIGRILDIFAPLDVSDVIHALIRSVLELFSNERADIASCVGLLPALRRYISPYFYLTPRQLNKPAWLLWKANPKIAAIVYDAMQWHVTQADSDIGFSP